MKKQLRTTFKVIMQYSILAIAFFYCAHMCSSQVLIEATKHNDPYEVDSLIKSTFYDVNEPDGKGITALMWASFYGYEIIVDILLDTPTIDINKVDQDGSTALIAAIRKNHPSIAEKLINHKNINGIQDIEVNKPDNSGMTPLLWAVQENNETAVDLLLKVKDIDTKKATTKGLSPFKLAMRNKNYAIMDLFIAHSHPVLTALAGVNGFDLVDKINQKPFKKSCLLTFTLEDSEGVLKVALIASLFRKTIVIANLTILQELILSYAPYTLSLFADRKWSLFLDKSQTLGIVIPYWQAEDHFAQEYGFKEQELKKIAPSSVQQILENVKSPVKSNVDTLITQFQAIIDTQNKNHLTRFLLVGHGDKGITIADIPLASFNKFLDVLNYIQAEFLYITSCYTSGENLIFMQQTIEKFVQQKIHTFASREGKEYPESSFGCNYYIVLQATAETISRGFPDTLNLFAGLDAFFTAQSLALEKSALRLKTAYRQFEKIPLLREKKDITFNDIIKDSIPKYASSLASVRYPGTRVFFRAIDIGNMEIVTHEKLQKMRWQNLWSLRLMPSYRKALIKLEDEKSRLQDEKPHDYKAQLTEIQHAIDNLNKIIYQSQECMIPLASTIQYVQVFPCDETDVIFIVKGNEMPAFISKIPGNGYHCIDQITFTSPIPDFNQAVQEAIEKGFIDTYETDTELKANICWFIKKFIITIAQKPVTLDKLIICIMPGSCEWMYIYNNQRYHYTYDIPSTMGSKRPAMPAKFIEINEDTFNAKAKKFAHASKPSEQALMEATGGKETTISAEKALEKFGPEQKLFGPTPLKIAIDEKDLQTAKDLIVGGADINTLDDNGETLLTNAISIGDRNKVQTLLALHANVNKQNKRGDTPLHIAISKDNYVIASLLIDNGADVNYDVQQVGTPLILATKNKSKKIITLLVKKGADINKEDGDDNTPLIEAVDIGDKEIVQLLLTLGADINKRTYRAGSALTVAVQKKNKALAELLIKKGADVNHMSNSGYTPLTETIKWNYQKESVEILLELGADVNLPTDAGETPLKLALENGDQELIELLKTHGAKE